MYPKSISLVSYGDFFNFIFLHRTTGYCSIILIIFPGRLFTQWIVKMAQWTVAAITGRHTRFSTSTLKIFQNRPFRNGESTQPHAKCWMCIYIEQLNCIQNDQFTKLLDYEVEMRTKSIFPCLPCASISFIHHSPSFSHSVYASGTMACTDQPTDGPVNNLH